MSATDTRSLVVDYVQYQLRKKALPWPGHPDATDGDADPDPTPTKVNQTMRLLGEEFEERYTQVFDQLKFVIFGVATFTTSRKYRLWVLCAFD